MPEAWHWRNDVGSNTTFSDLPNLLIPIRLPHFLSFLEFGKPVAFPTLGCNAMLRIAINDDPSEQRWILQGRLSGPWVAQLKSSWKKTEAARETRKCVVDLNE